MTDLRHHKSVDERKILLRNKILNPTVVKLGLVSFFADVSSEMLYPITPIFLTTVLGSSMASIGFIEGFAEAISSLLKTFSGTWSDRISRRKPFVALGYFLSAASKPLVGISVSWTSVLIARGLDRTGKGLRTAPRDALLAEAVAPKLRGAAFGWHRGMDTMGAAIGPLFAILYLSTNSENLRNIYFWALVPGLISVGISLLVREADAANKQSRSHFSVSSDIRRFSDPFKTYLLSWSLFSLTNSSDVFLLLKAKSEGVGLTEVILLYCTYNLVYSLFSPFFGHLSDRIGRRNLLIAGLVAFAGVYMGFSLATSRWHFWILFSLYGLYMATTEGVGKAMAVDLIEPSRKGEGLGVLGTVTGLSTVIASTLAGLIWDQWGSFYTFAFGALGAVASVIVLIRIKEPAT